MSAQGFTNKGRDRLLIRRSQVRSLPRLPGFQGLDEKSLSPFLFRGQLKTPHEAGRGPQLGPPFNDPPPPGNIGVGLMSDRAMTDEEIIQGVLEGCSLRTFMVPDPAMPSNHPEHRESYDPAPCDHQREQILGEVRDGASNPTFPIYHPNSWKSYHFPTAKGTVSLCSHPMA